MAAKRDNRVPIMMSDDERDAINEWRHKCRIATLSEAIRRLCKTALVLDAHNEADKRDWLASLDPNPSKGHALGAMVPENGWEPGTIRICPDRDGPCPHGLGCPYMNKEKAIIYLTNPAMV
jgi:hypothetical protein